jgi:excinuclease UvrABC nuclease subunit
MSSKCLIIDSIEFKRSNIEFVVPEEPGVYMFWARRLCLYVGKADNLRSRLLQHWRDCHNQELKNWMRVHGSKLCISYLVSKRSLPVLEQEYIDRLSPHLNKINARAQ